MTFKAFTTVATLATATLVLPFSAHASETITIGYQKANIFQLIKSQGSLDKALAKDGVKIKWVEFPAGPQMLEGLNIGSIDLAATGDAPPAFAQAAQASLVYLGHSPATPKTEAIVVPKGSSIKSVADLKGKRVALNKGSDVNYLLLKALEKAGLDYSDIQPVYLAPDSARAAFQSGAVDAWAVWDPFLADAENTADAREITNAQGLVPHYTFFLASKKFADGSPGKARDILHELDVVSQWANQHHQEAAQLLAKSTGLKLSTWQTSLARMPFGAQRMSNKVYDEQQLLADSFSKAHLLPGKVDARSALWVEDKGLSHPSGK